MKIILLLSILNPFFIASPFILYFHKKNAIKEPAVLSGVVLILIYGIIEFVSFIVSNIALIYVADILFLAGILIIFSYSKYKKIFSLQITPILTLGTTMITIFVVSMYINFGLTDPSYIAISVIYFLACYSISLFYIETSKNLLSYLSGLVFMSGIIICCIYDAKFYAGIIDINTYVNAPWHLQYILQSTAGIICSISIYLNNRLNT